MNFNAISAIYKFEMARALPHPDPKPGFAGDFNLALFRGLWRRHRLAHPGNRRHQLRLLHRAGPDHAVAAHPKHRQCLVRHLFPLALSAPFLSCSRLPYPILKSSSPMSAPLPPSRLSWESLLLATAARFFVPLEILHPLLDARLSRADRGDLQPLRLHHRHLG